MPELFSPFLLSSCCQSFPRYTDWGGGVAHRYASFTEQKYRETWHQMEQISLQSPELQQECEMIAALQRKNSCLFT